MHGKVRECGKRAGSQVANDDDDEFAEWGSVATIRRKTEAEVRLRWPETMYE